MARCVPGAMANIQCAIADLNRVAVDQPAIGCEGLGQRKVEHAALVREPVNPELVAHVRANDGQVQPAGQFSHATCVVNVRMGQPNGFKVQVAVCNRLGEFFKVAARVDDRCLVGFTAPHDGTVLRELGDWNREVLKHERGLEWINGSHGSESIRVNQFCLS